MTIASEISRVDLVGDGINDTFAFTFEIYAKTDIAVYVGGILKTVDIHYTVPIAGIENPDGGNVMFTAGNKPGALVTVAIILNVPLTQLVDYGEADKFPAETHERALDRVVKIAQWLKEGLSKVPSLVVSSLLSDLIIPEAANRAIGWNTDATELTTFPTTPINRANIDSLDVDYSGSLATMVAAVGANNRSVLVDTAGDLTANLEIPDNIHLVWLDGCPWDGAYSLTIGKLEAGSYQLFGDDITVTFGSGAVKEVYPEWWGNNTIPGTTDMIDALQAAVNAGFGSHIPVALQNTTYRTSKPIIVYGYSVALSPQAVSKIVGSSREGTIIKKYGNDDAGSGEAYESNSIIIVADEGAYAGGAATGNAKWVHLENLTLEGNSTDVEYGLSFPINSSDFKGVNLRIKGHTHSGVYIDGNHWMSRWDKLYIQGGQYGFNFASGIGTSTIWTHPYVIGTTVTAYNINGTYQTMICPAADGCTGTVYDLSSYKGTLISPGSESGDAEIQILAGQFSDITIIEPYFLGNFDSATATAIDVRAGGKAQFFGGRVGYDGTEADRTAPGYIYKLAANGKLSFYHLRQGKYTLSSSSGEFSEKTVTLTNGVNQRTGSVDIAANATTTVTITFGTELRGPITVDFSGYTTSHAGSVMVKVTAGGYLPNAAAENVSKIIDSSVNGTLTISAITKTAYGFSFDVINAHGTAVGELHWVATGIFSAITVIAS